MRWLPVGWLALCACQQAAPEPSIDSGTPEASPPPGPTASEPALPPLTLQGFPVGFKPTVDDPYPCADPTDICDILTRIGCSFGRTRGCLGAVSRLGEGVCLKLAEAKSAPAVQALGVPCKGQ